MSVIKLGRRHFLSGVGGFTLAIPFLGSLEREARAGDGGTPASKVQPRYLYLATNHGGCWDTSFFPNVQTTQSVSVPGVPGHTVSSGPLAATVSGSRATMSAVLNASATALTAKLVGKMNVLRGLDVPWYLAHNTGLLGNFARNDGNGGDGSAVAALGGRPTIDQLMASSNSFYTAANKATTKAASVIVSGGTQPYSWALTTPGNVTGGVTPVTDNLSSLKLFQSIFGTSSGTAAKARTPVVDLVRGNYNSLMQGNTRLSAADKIRLSQHVDMLSTLESSLTATLACSTPPTPPMDNSAFGPYGTTPNPGKWGQLYADVIAAAFACNASRISVFGFGDTSGFSPGFAASGQTDWHQQVAHKWNLDQPQGWLLESYQAFFEQVLVYVAAKLDGMIDVDGNTVLDNSLVVWGQECCMETHEQYGIQTVTFGGAAGTMNTGLYCDYRQNGQTAAAINPAANGGASSSASLAGYVTYPGLLWEQWLATQMLAMGLTAADWELWKDGSGATEHGYGTPYVTGVSWMPNYAAHYLPGATWSGGSPTSNASPYFANASTALPFLLK